jgi:hypothetical protein
MENVGFLVGDVAVTKLTVDNFRSICSAALRCFFVGAMLAAPLPVLAQTAQKSTTGSTAKHFTDGQAMPGIGTAIGDVYVLPDGGCYGGKAGSGIHWSNGAKMIFGTTISAQSPVSACRGLK